MLRDRDDGARLILVGANPVERNRDAPMLSLMTPGFGPWRLGGTGGPQCIRLGINRGLGYNPADTSY